MEYRTLESMILAVSGKILFQKDYQKLLSRQSQIPEEKTKSIIMNWPGESGIAGVMNELVIPFAAVWIQFKIINWIVSQRTRV